MQIQPSLINLNSNENSQEFDYDQFSVKLDGCVGHCNTLNDLSNKVCAPNKAEDSNRQIFDMITGKNEWRNLTKDISCECKYKFGIRNFNSNQKWISDKCRWECKKHHICEKDYIWNPDACRCKNCKYLAGIVDSTVIMCDKITEEIKTVATYFNEKSNLKKATHNFFILLIFLLIIIALLIVASIYSYLTKYQTKEKYLFYFTSQMTN